MAELKQLQYVGGPFAGGTAPDDFIDRIDMRSPAGTGAYVLAQDEETGTQFYRWEPEAAGQGATR
ncbi:hypothetical protein [Streptomyces sp. CL12-4]|uniref:hypothetical protein n=1 Tax=Streptomyces sp. CL12-4 TaxID=2810306 RepID=UPI001EFADC38|nr:hypothetical protein [Streptomyces sp. CL12-4]MCG8971799.1 hypothetical protein [Streptomyces sp. CL12-4]